MGCMMMKTEILKKIEPPYFNFEYYDGDWHGEDFYFQQKLRSVGYKILIDMNLSTQVRHIGQWAFGSSLGVNEEKRIAGGDGEDLRKKNSTRAQLYAS